MVEDLRKILPALAAADCNGKIRLRLVLDRLRAIASDPKDPQRATAADLLKDLAAGAQVSGGSYADVAETVSPSVQVPLGFTQPALQLPGIFSQPTTFTRTLSFESTTLGQPCVLRVFRDLQSDLSIWNACRPSPDQRLSVESRLLLQAGMDDVRSGRVSTLQPDRLEGPDED